MVSDMVTRGGKLAVCQRAGDGQALSGEMKAGRGMG